MRLTQLSPFSLNFPSPECALREPNGLLALGGDLSPSRLMLAYQSGIFPWYSPGDPILWWSPDPRAVLYPQRFHQSRSFQRFLRHNPYRVTLNQDFDRVIALCAANREEGTWITPEISMAYRQLHQQGVAHSIEVWRGPTLVGGIYGVALGALFCGESMFSLADNASKTGLWALCHHLIRQGGQLIDCQVINPHTASLGAEEMSRRDYLAALAGLQTKRLAPDAWQAQTLNLAL